MKNGNMSLLYVCKSGNSNEKIVKYIVEYGEDINKENLEENTSLFYACMNNNNKVNIVKYLLEFRADANKYVVSLKSLLGVAMKIYN